MKIGRAVTYLLKNIEHVETYSLYESGHAGAIAKPQSPEMDTMSSNRSVTTPRPRTP